MCDSGFEKPGGTVKEKCTRSLLMHIFASILTRSSVLMCFSILKLSTSRILDL